jgi:hypothetical protein
LKDNMATTVPWAPVHRTGDLAGYVLFGLTAPARSVFPDVLCSVVLVRTAQHRPAWLRATATDANRNTEPGPASIGIRRRGHSGL